jgi:hypothetical protein
LRQCAAAAAPSTHVITNIGSIGLLTAAWPLSARRHARISALRAPVVTPFDLRLKAIVRRADPAEQRQLTASTALAAANWRRSGRLGLSAAAAPPAAARRSRRRTEARRAP